MNCPALVRAQKNQIQDLRGGKEYDSDFSKRMTGEGISADLIRERFTMNVKRLGMDGYTGRFSRLDASQFKRPLVVPQPVKAKMGAAVHFF